MNLLTVGWKKLIILSNMFDRKEIVEVEMVILAVRNMDWKIYFNKTNLLFLLQRRITKNFHKYIYKHSWDTETLLQ